MKWTLLLLGVFIVQEPVSANAVLLEAYQHGYNVWLIHILFILGTLFDVVVGYALGKFVHRRYAQSRFVKYIERKTSAFTGLAGKGGQRIGIIIYGPILFPISAFLAPWLGIGFWDALIFLFIGELLLWYLLLWVVVLGIKIFVPDPAIALYGVLILSLVIIMIKKHIDKKALSKDFHESN